MPNTPNFEGNPTPLEKGWFTFKESQPFGKAAQYFFFGGSRQKKPKPKPTDTVSFSMELTQHCCARGLGKQRDEQEVDEVDEGQGIVPEEASCRHTDAQSTAHPLRSNNKHKGLFKTQLIQQRLYCAALVV